MAKEIKRTFCRGMDDGGCGLLVTTENGQAVKIAGDPECLVSRGYICQRGKAYLELLYHSQRLTFPLIREGERGAGQWRRASWDEALNFAASKLNEIKDRHSARSICFACGSPKGLEVFFMHRLASLIGTPNVSTPANICHLPRELGHTFVFGAPSYPDLDNIPKSLILWGINLLATNVGTSANRLWMQRVIKSGAKIIVIDPRKVEPASKAKWVRIRPGSDAALALALLKVTVEEELYDHDFVSRWVVGWEEFKQYLAKMDLAKLAEITWLKPEQVRDIARTYAENKPGVILLGNAIDHSPDSLQTARAIAMLKAINGNVDVPGGEIIHGMPPVKPPVEFGLISMRGEKQNEMVGAEFKIARRNIFVPRQAVTEAILEEKPYPLKAGLLFGSNPLVTYADSARTYEAMKKLEFLMVTDFFMTPTAELADLVLPAATFLEYDEIGYYGSRYGKVVARPQVVEPVGECWSDIKIMNELGKRLGFAQHFWSDMRQMLDFIVQPAGLSFEQFKEKGGILYAEKRYKKHEDKGFRTPSGKVELYSKQLQEMGYSPLPTYTEPASSPDYPLVLTCAKNQYYHHSGYRQIASLRKIYPEPRVQVNQQTASKLGLKEGDWAYIETNKGRIKQRVKLNADLDPRVVFADFGWWYPERGREHLYDWQESNFNMLTDSRSPAEPAIGSTYLRSIPCRLRKIK